METSSTRRQWLAAAMAAALPAGAQAEVPAVDPNRKPFQIYAITFRGMTEVEKGFADYLSSRKIPVRITYRDLNRDATRMPGFIEEIKATKPDLIYTWGTSVTLGVVGAYDTPNPGQYINDIPVLFTLVAAPTMAKIVKELAAPRRNVSGVTHVGSTDAQMRAMAKYRPFKTVGVLYTPTEQNSVAVMKEMRRIGDEKGFRVIERTFKLDGNRKPTAEGAADLLREIKESGAEWLYLPPDSYLGTLAEALIIPTAMQMNLPTFASTEQLMQAGALSGLVSRYYNVGQFTAHKAEQILVGRESIANIPVETLSRFSYQVRMPAARQLKMPPPLPLLSYAELITTEVATQ
jgi:putative ABC transport system substrate-binding protein